MKTKLTVEQLQIVQGNNGLKRYLESLLKGKDYTPRSWLYEDQDADAVLEAWLKKLSTLQKGSTFEANVFQFDTSQLEKWGPQGGVAPISELYESLIQPSFKETPNSESVFGTDAWKEAKSKALHQLNRIVGNETLRPAMYDSVYDDMRARDVIESNSGWPDFTRRSKPDVRAAAIKAAEDGSWKTYPAIILFRNYNNKTRPVWMYPLAVNLVEGSFFQPLYAALSGSKTHKNSHRSRYLTFFSPWRGFEDCRNAVTSYYGWNYFLSASDFTATDEHFRWETTQEVFDVIKHLFQRKYWDGLYESLHYMHHIPLIIGPDEMETGAHGVSSGSNWTNFIETIFDLILSEYVGIITKGNTKGLYGIGDDIAWYSCTYDEKLPETLEKIGKGVGQVINSSKTTNEMYKVKSLQRLFQKGYVLGNSLRSVRAVYSTIRALKSSIYPERFHDPRKWSADMFCARQFMILENCKDHPLFEDFVKFICKGNAHLIPFAKKTASELDKITRESKLLPGLNATYNQEKRDSSLATFESIKIARTL
nr:MAG: RNA-dependent RNA polymerase [Porcine picobirnavirus]